MIQSYKMKQLYNTHTFYKNWSFNKYFFFVVFSFQMLKLKMFNSLNTHYLNVRWWKKKNYNDASAKIQKLHQMNTVLIYLQTEWLYVFCIMQR